MKLEVKENLVTITGNIKSINDYQEIKKEIELLKLKYKNIRIDIIDSISITSSIIGYINKIILADKINVTMYVKDKKLYNLLEDLNLTKVFKQESKNIIKKELDEI